MLTLFSMLRLVLKRLMHNLGLSASTLVGIIAILTVAVCVPIFSHAVSSEVLRQQLYELKGKSNSRPLFALRLKYEEKSEKSKLDLDKCNALSDFLLTQFPAELGLPVERVLLDTFTGSLVVSDLNNRWPEARNAPLGSWTFVVQEALPANANLVEGVWPAADNGGTGPIQIALPEAMADEMLLRVGDRFLLSELEVVVTGFYRIKDTASPLWFNNPEAEYSRAAWIPLATYLSRVKPVVPQSIGVATWYVTVNNNDVHFQRAAQYLHGLQRVDAALKQIVDGLSIVYTPAAALEAYEKRADALATLFYVVGSPMIVLALIFIGLTSAIAVQQHENETATLRSRGTSIGQVLLLNLLESTLLLAVALPLSLLTGWLASALMGNTLSFLQFTDRPAFSFSLDGLNLSMLGAALGIILLARFFPMISAARINVLRVKQDQSRSSRKPFWERFFLDFFLLIPSGYAFFVLKGWSSPAAFLSQLQLPTDQQFRDPLLFVAPAVFAIAACMVITRFIPLLVRLLAFVVERFSGVTAYLSLQQVARRSQDHSTALLLIMISLSLAIFTVSTAKTLDQWLYDSEYYKTGADLALQEYLVSESGGGEVSASSSRIESFLTIEEHLALPGVEAATRVAKYSCSFSYGRGDQSCLVIGIDRLDFVRTAFFRDDFTTNSLGELMNNLGSNLSGVIFPATLMQKTGVAVGDRIAMTISVGSQKYDREWVVVGSYDYFPTVYPKDRPTLVVNLDSIFNYPEDIEDYQILLKLKPETDTASLIKEIAHQISDTSADIRIVGNPREAVWLGQDKPERIGLFGVLNVGFITTGLMPGIGFLLYSYASLRRRFIQLGILQALGLSVSQLVASLVIEQVMLMGLAISAGAGIGLATSLMFVPFLQTGATPGAPIPPFQVLIGWTESGLLSLAFGLVLLVTMLGTIFYLTRLKVFQAVKLGETL